jgi:benzoyl-CoA reductase/2-hydroxyglutaryl-CoA dehydratase subunit BcrC/BadD/HgdB
MTVTGKNGGIFKYPEIIRERFESTGDIVFSDGHRVTAHEVWRFMTEEAPERWPRAFDITPFNMGHVSEDITFFSGIKQQYLSFTLCDRLEEARRKGIPLVMIQGGQPMEMYYAAGTLPLRPAFVLWWARDKEDGLNLRQADFRSNTNLEKGRREISVDACHQVAAHQILEEKIVEVDLIAPYLNLRCSDMAYLTETHRVDGNEKGIPLQLIDYPANLDGTREWSVQYTASGLHRLADTLSQLTGKPLANEAIRKEIVRHNKLRSLVREIVDLYWNARVPPLSSADFRAMMMFGHEPWLDVDASVSILEEAKEEIRQRVSNGVKGFGLANDPARLFVCGSCVTANPYLVDKAGGVVVCQDDGWSESLTDAQAEGDPYISLASSLLSLPYEFPTKDRAVWTSEQVRRSRADGLLFIYNWGCNFQSAPARMVADIVKETVGIPTSHIGSSELGRDEAVAQFQNRVEAFIEMLRLRKGFTQRIGA